EPRPARAQRLVVAEVVAADAAEPTAGAKELCAEDALVPGALRLWLAFTDRNAGGGCKLGDEWCDRSGAEVGHAQVQPRPHALPLLEDGREPGGTHLGADHRERRRRLLQRLGGSELPIGVA